MKIHDCNHGFSWCYDKTVSSQPSSGGSPTHTDQVAAILPPGYDMYFYRTHGGAEADMVLAQGGTPEIMVEIKFNSNPTLSPGFHISKNDLKTKRHFVICPIKKPFPLHADVEAIGLDDLAAMFRPS